MPNDRVLRAVLRFTFDKKTAGEAKRGVISISDAIEELEVHAEETQMAMSQLTAGVELFGIVGEQMAGVGRAISDPLSQAAQSYLVQAGRADQLSRRWLDSTQDLQKAQVRVGRAAAQAIVPAMEQAADLAEKASKFVERHPDIIAAALKIGTVMAALGAVGTAVSRGIRLYADVKLALVSTQQLIASKIMARAAKQQLVAAAGMGASRGVGAAIGGVGAAAGGAGAGAAATGGAGAVAAGGAGLAIGMVAAVVAGGVALGGVVNEILAQTGILGDGFATTGEIAVVAASQVGKLAGKEVEWGAAVAHLTGQIDDATYASYQAAQATEESTDATTRSEAALRTYIDHQRELAQMTEQNERELTLMAEQGQREDLMMEIQYQRMRSLALRDFERDRAEAEKSFDYQRLLATRDFGRQEAEIAASADWDRLRETEEYVREETSIQEDYYRERAEMAASFGLETRRIEEDHQRQMRYAQEDHDVRIMEAVGSRDALAMAQEQRSYEKDRRRAEEEYNVEAARRHEDFAREAAEMEANFAREREQRQRDYDLRLMEQQEQGIIERDLRKAEFVLRQQDEREAFEQERQQAHSFYRRQMGDMAEEQQYEQAMSEEQRAYELGRMEEQFNYERQMADERLADRLREIDEDEGMLGERERAIRNSYYDVMAGDLDVFLAGMRNQFQTGLYYSGVSVPSYQHGGYAGAGIYQLGEAGDEFILSAATTRAAESLLHGSLTQANALSAMAGGVQGGRGSQGVVINQRYTFQGQFSDAERQWFRDTARREAASVFGEVLH